MKWECRSCGGIYDDADGNYYHACPMGTDNPRDENVQETGVVTEDIKGVTHKRTQTRLKKEGKGRRPVA